MKDGDYLVQKRNWQLALQTWLKYCPKFSDLMFLLMVDSHPAQLANYNLETHQFEMACKN